MGRVLYFDCFAGAAGDMILGALLDAGLPADQLRSALGSLGVGHAVDITRVMRAGIAATYVSVREAGDGKEPGRPHAHHHHGDHGHGHSHAHSRAHGAGGHGHRTLEEIRGLIDASALSTGGKAKAKALFGRIAEAEAAIHDMPIDRVHLHEVGALDSIIDIVGAVFAMEWFGIDDVCASPLNVGAGTVTMAHGTFPVPAPATLRLLAGVPVYSTGVPSELVTPTGALVISDYARSYGPLPAMAVDRIGYGAGTRDLGALPNVLRVVIGERTAPTTSAGRESILQIECEIDDMNPQIFGPVSDQLLAAGAVDVFLTPVQMKKGRPGTLLTVLAPEAKRGEVCDLLFRETTTIGVRFQSVWRETLDRHSVEVPVLGGVVRIKIAGRRGEVLNVAPEFDDCVRVASDTGLPVKAVQAEALRVWSERNSP